MGLFVNINNTIYVANRQNNTVLIWFEGDIYPNKIISGGLNQPYSLYSTLSDDLYVDNGISNSRVDKWAKDSNTSIPVMMVAEQCQCYSIFVDISNTLYCSMHPNHRVAKKWLGDTGTTLTVAAGNGGTGSGSANLKSPTGIYVDINFNLYVGDCGNDRVQKFALGQMNAISIVGSNVPGTIALNCPNAITFDANGYIYLTDTANHRLIGSGPYGFRCLFGCAPGTSNSPSEFQNPRSFNFDSYGNIYVADQSNNRIQKFILASNSCSK